MRYILFATILFLAATAGNAQKSAGAADIIISQNSTYLKLGQQLVISVQAVGDKERIIRLSIGGSYVKFDKNGFAEYRRTATYIGTSTIPIYLYLKDEKGREVQKEYKVEYRVGK